MRKAQKELGHASLWWRSGSSTCTSTFSVQLQLPDHAFAQASLYTSGARLPQHDKAAQHPRLRCRPPRCCSAENGQVYARKSSWWLTPSPGVVIVSDLSCWAVLSARTQCQHARLHATDAAAVSCGLPASARTTTCSHKCIARTHRSAHAGPH